METKELGILQAGIASLGTEIKGLLDKQEAQIKANGTLSAETKAAFDAAKASWATIEAKIVELDKKNLELATKLARFEAMPVAGPNDLKSIGGILVSSKEFKSAREAGQWNSKPVVFETKGLNAPLEVKAGELTSTEIGSVVRPYRYEQIITPPSRPRKLAALIPSIPVAGNSIEFPRENVTAELYEVLSAQANAAQKDFVLTRTAEGFYSGQSVILSQGLAQEETVVVDTIDYETLTITAASNLTQTHPALRTAISHTFVFTPEAKVKPLSHIEFELATETVKTLATIMPVSKQMLDDAPALQAYIDTRLNEFREMAKESQILYGDKSTRQIQGILTHADIQQLDWSDGSVGDTKIDAIRRAVTLCMLSFLPPDVLVINPNDLEDVELEKGIDGHYMFAQQMVSAAGVTQLWRLQVVETSAIEEGHALVGSFRLGAIIWDRQQAEVSISDQNRDWWEKNLLGIRVEERLALSLTRPSAFVDLHFDNTPPAP